jgi:hypothetical protein
MAKCAAVTRAGTACKGTPIDGSQWCYAHNPASADERRRHGKRGGKRGGRGRPLAELADLKRRLSNLADSVLSGGANRADAAVVGQLLNTIIRAIATELRVREQQELIERLEELEAVLEHQKGDSIGYG